MFELVTHERFREKAVPVDIGPYRNHGKAENTATAAGAVAGQTAIAFPNEMSRVAIGIVDKRQWAPLVALRVEAVVNVDPNAARMLAIVEGSGAFYFGIQEKALEARIPGGAYVRSDSSFSPDGAFHAVPANRWVTVALHHDGYTKMRLLIDGEVVGETPIAAGVPPVYAGGVIIGNQASGGRPLLGALDEIRILREDPEAIHREFWCRPHTQATADCWEAIFKKVVAWGTSHPTELQALRALASTERHNMVRALYLLPLGDQAKIGASLRAILPLWCSGRIDGDEMRDALMQLRAALQGAGTDLGFAKTAAAMETVRRRYHLDVSVSCDPAFAGFLQLLGQTLIEH